MVKLTVDSLSFGGDGVGRDADGRVTFVPGAAPGDRVEARLVEEHKGYAHAALERVIEPGASRVAPGCALFSECGGCQWQHVAIDAQRAAKQEIVRRALRKVTDSVAPIVTPSPDYRWRRRARLRLRGGALGYHARRSHRMVDVATCPQLEPALDAALAAVRARLLPVFAGSGELELLCSLRGEVQVAVEGRGAAALGEAAAALLGSAGIVGVLLREEERAEPIVVGAEMIDLADDPAGPFWARADAFAQVSAPGNAALRALVVAGAGAHAGQQVLELHAGSANFTRDLAAAAAHVTAVEEAPLAAALAARTLAGRGLAERISWRAVPVAAALAGAARPDLVVLDPPRTGLNPGEAAALAALAAPRIVYVSCDPETLARDLAIMVAAGYRVASATPVDLMPQTYHVETVVALDLTPSSTA